MSIPQKGTIFPYLSRDNCLLYPEVSGDYYPRMTKTFRDALKYWIEKTGKSFAEVARESGVSYEQIKKLSQGKSQSTNVDDAVKIANHFGMTLEEFLEDETVAVRSEIVEIYNSLSEQERRFLLASAKGLRGEQADDTPQSSEDHPST